MFYVYRKRTLRTLFRIVDAIGMACFFWKKMKAPPKTVREILVIRLDHIGDLVLMSPFYEVLRSKFPDARITVLTNPWGRELYRPIEAVSQITVIEGHWFRRGGAGISWRQVGGILGSLRQVRFDLAFDPRGDVRHIALLSCLRCRYRVGYGITGGGFLLNRCVSYDPSRHAMERNLDCLRSLGIDVQEGLMPRLPLDPRDRELAEGVLKDCSVPSHAQTIVLHTEAGMPAKAWPGERYSRLVADLLKNGNCHVFLVGTRKGDEERGFSSADGRCHDLRGRTSLRGLLALIGACNLFIGPDSGPSHMAGAVGVPVVVLASGVNRYDEWSVRTNKYRVLRHEVACSPCGDTTCRLPVNECMAGITVEDVLNAAEEIAGRPIRPDLKE